MHTCQQVAGSGLHRSSPEWQISHKALKKYAFNKIQQEDGPHSDHPYYNEDVLFTVLRYGRQPAMLLHPAFKTEEDREILRRDGRGQIRGWTLKKRMDGWMGS